MPHDGFDLPGLDPYQCKAGGVCRGASAHWLFFRLREPSISARVQETEDTYRRFTWARSR